MLNTMKKPLTIALEQLYQFLDPDERKQLATEFRKHLKAEAGDDASKAQQTTETTASCPPGMKPDPSYVTFSKDIHQMRATVNRFTSAANSIAAKLLPRANEALLTRVNKALLTRANEPLLTRAAMPSLTQAMALPPRATMALLTQATMALLPEANEDLSIRETMALLAGEATALLPEANEDSSTRKTKALLNETIMILLTGEARASLHPYRVKSTVDKIAQFLRDDPDLERAKSAVSPVGQSSLKDSLYQDLKQSYGLPVDKIDPSVILSLYDSILQNRGINPRTCIKLQVSYAD